MFGMNLLSKTPEWPLLKKEAASLKPILPMHSLYLDVAGIHCELSYNYINDKILNLLSRLCQSQGVMQFFQGMKQGDIVNLSEKRPALHTALRDLGNMKNSVKDHITASFYKMQSLTEAIHKNRAIRHVVHIGIGGSDHGPRFLIKALAAYKINDLSFHFIANIDPSELQDVLKAIDIKKTLFIVSSKSFATDETLTNFSSLCLAINADKNMIEKQCIAITANQEKALAYGFKEDNILLLNDGVGGRFSIWSAVGFSLMLAIGIKNFQDFLAGAARMDEGCSTEIFLDNPALLLAAMDCWYTNFLEAPSRAILIYSSPLNGLIHYLQQLIMESNGKSKSMWGLPLDYQTSPIIWGGLGSNSQHTFQQLLIQGTRLNPVDIILPRSSGVNFAEQQAKLVAHCLAQAEALTLARDRQGQPYHLFTFEKLSPHSIGALLALYEHRTVMTAALWAINPFDQFGVELSKNLLSDVEKTL
jgi:glucose-6-phosphate isomerase